MKPGPDRLRFDGMVGLVGCDESEIEGKEGGGGRGAKFSVRESEFGVRAAALFEWRRKKVERRDP